MLTKIFKTQSDDGIQCVVGGSMGGMQALEWTIQGGNFVKGAVPLHAKLNATE